MGNDLPTEERECNYRELYNGIYSIEKDILNELKKPYSQNKSYIIYGLINKGLCQKYPYLLKEKFDYNLTLNYNFDYKDLPNSNDERDFRYFNKDFLFTFPSNFIFINEDFMDLIRSSVKDDKIKKRLVSKYDTIIGGGCLIMKNPYDYKSQNPFRYIILYSEIKEKEGNEIDFFLYIKDKQKREDIVNYILQNGLLAFFDKIGYSYKEEYKIFEKNCYIVRSNPIDKFESYLINNKITINIQRKNIGINAKNLLNSLLLSLFQIKPLILEINNNQELDFNDFTKKINSLLDQKLNKINNYENLFDEIITKIEISLGIDKTKEFYNQSEQYDENKSKMKFLKKYENAKIIQKYIQIPTEEIISCSFCGTSCYTFKYNKFFYLNETLNYNLSEKIFHSNKENKLHYCNFCNGKKTNCFIENKFIDYPEVLIIIIENNQINKFILQKYNFF